MEWIKTILEQHKLADGTVELDAVMNDIKKEFPKQAVPKDVYNQAAEDLKAANTLVEDLKASSKDAEGLQTKITEYETKVADLESERAAERKSYALKETLTKEGAADLDYMLYKLGDVETDADGNIVDLDNKVKALKEANPTFFTASAAPDQPAAPGYQPLDNKLDQGKPSDPNADAAAAFEAALGLQN